MSPLWYLRRKMRSSAALHRVLTLSAVIVGVSILEPTAWAGRDKPPVAMKDLVATEAGSEVDIRALANDFDPEGTKVRLKRVKKPTKGKVEKGRGGIIKYTPDETAEGTDKFRYVIKDRNGKGKKAKGKVVVNILPASNPGGDNDPPVADAGPNRSVTVGQSTTLDGSGSFDPNDDPLTYSWSLVEWPTGSTADFSNSTMEKPVFVADIAGTFIAELLVHDGTIRSAADQVEIVAAADTPPPPPPGQTFADLCADSGVIMCQDFDTDTSNANFNNNPYSPANPTGIGVDNAVFAEGGGSLRLTIDGSKTEELSGTIGYQWPETVTSGTYYTAWKMYFGDGLQTLLRSQGFEGGGGGIKYMQIVAGTRSCSSEEIVFYDGKEHTISTGVPLLVYSCSGWPVDVDGNYQNDPNCDFNHVMAVRSSGGILGNPPCRVFEDGVWHQIEMEVTIGVGYRVWIDGVLAIDSTSRPPAGPYGRSYMGNYITGYGLWGHPMAGSRTYGDGLWRVYYDNLIVSRNCITSCGQ